MSAELILQNETPADMRLRIAQTKQIEQGLIYADKYVNRQYMVGLPMYEMLPEQLGSFSDMRLFHIEKLVYDADEDLNDKLISLYGALNCIGSTAVLLLKSSTDGVDLYLGTCCALSASTAGGILQAGILGNFTGSTFSSLTGQEIEAVMRPFASNMQSCVSTVTLVPSLRDKEKKNTVQGIEKLMDGLTGRDFMAIIIAEPMQQADIETQKRGLEELYSTISPHAETSLAYGNNASYAVADGTSKSFSDSINNSVTNSTSESTSQSTTHGSSSGTSSSFGQDGSSFGSNSGTSYSESYSSSTSWSRAVASGQTKTTTTGTTQTITNTIGESRTFTIKHINKSVSELMKNIDAQLQRIRACESFGLWSAAAYFISNDVQSAAIAASTFRSLVAGDDSYLDKSIINMWEPQNRATRYVLNTILHGRHPRIQVPRMNEFESQVVKPTVLVSGKELPIFMSLPRKSLPGTLVDFMASFGRTVFNPEEDRKHEFIPLGCVRHKGIENENLTVHLDIEELRAHCFVTGSTGSGKSNTTYHILNELIAKEKNFLVIEPAKGEYKYAFGKLPKVNIFWTNPKYFKLLHLNPFSFPNGIHVLEHMDRLIEILNVCWPLYSAMPAILKSAIERAYNSCGWDLITSIWIDVGKNKFPTFNDLLRELPNVINESSYSADAKGDYTGALVTRVSSLTNGIMGNVLCSDIEISDEVLFDENTIVDLSRVGSTETKSLLMGILIMKLNEHRMSAGAGMNSNLKHVTVLEEAHNLLRRTGGGNDLAAKSVEMLSNSIAEMRSYGEGFIIVDQSPTSVDISAIKNTNTKIVMRLPEKSDFEAVGGSFGLTEEQIREISRLPRGSAIVSQSGWLEPILTAIHRASDQYELTTPPAEALVSNTAVRNFIDLVLSMMENLMDNDLRISRFLRNAELFDNKKEALLSAYQQLKQQVFKAEELTDNMRAEFVIKSIGCVGLAKVFPLKLEPKMKADSWRIYTNWKKKVADALDRYGDFGTMEEKMEIAGQLMMYMAVVLHDDTYYISRRVLMDNR